MVEGLGLGGVVLARDYGYGFGDALASREPSYTQRDGHAER